MSAKPKRTTFRIRLEEMLVSLRNDIGMGRYAPGDFLPSEHRLIEQFSLSKNSVRKGLEQLVEQGLVEKVPRIGTRVVQNAAEAAVTIRLGYFSTLLEHVNLMTLLNRFHRTYPGIVVQPVPLPSTRFASELADFLNAEPIDVVTVNNEMFETLLENGPASGQLEPLEPSGSLYPFLNRPFTEAGTLYVQPFVFSPFVLAYNKVHFRETELTVPDDSWTWDDVAAASKRLSASRGHLGFYMHYLSINRWPLFLLQSGIRFGRSPEGRLAFDRDLLRTAAATGSSLLAAQNVASAYLSERDADAEALFAQQKVSMIVTSYFSLNSLRETDLDYDIAPLPHSGKPATLMLAIGLAVNKQSGKKQAAKTFVDYCTGEEAQLFIRKTTLSLPSRKEAAEWSGPDGLNRPSRHEVYRDLVPTYRLYADMNIRYAELVRICAELKLYWAGLDDMDTVSRRIEETV